MLIDAVQKAPSLGRRWKLLEVLLVEAAKIAFATADASGGTGDLPTPVRGSVEAIM